MADDNKTLQGKSVMPSLTVDNIQESLVFFAALGFEVEDRWEATSRFSFESLARYTSPMPPAPRGAVIS